MLLDLGAIGQAAPTALTHLAPSLFERSGATLLILLQHDGRQFVRIGVLLHDGVR